VLVYKRVKKVFTLAKGARGARSRQYRRAKETTKRALAYAYRDRRNKKREYRALWITRINAAARAAGITYSQFMQGLKKKKIELSRNMLACLAIEEPKAFAQIIALSQEEKEPKKKTVKKQS